MKIGIYKLTTSPKLITSMRMRRMIILVAENLSANFIINFHKEQ